MWTMLADLAPTIIPIVILYFEVLGVFGNSNLILATIRKENLQTKHGVLLALTSFYQMMCLLGELVNVYFALSGKEIKRDVCFMLMSPYLVFSHKVARLWVYVGIASIPAVGYAVLVISLAVAEMVSRKTNPKILLCNPPLSMHPRVTNFWIAWNGFSNLGVLIIYVAVYVVVSNRAKGSPFMEIEKRNQILIHSNNSFTALGPLATAYGLDKRHRKMGRFVKQSTERKILISLLWLMTFFASTWCTCNIILVIVAWFEQSQEVAAIQSYVALELRHSFTVAAIFLSFRNWGPTDSAAFAKQQEKLENSKRANNARDAHHLWKT
ncbi:hypothetical protein ANCCEY_03787 [Ancylostoma ceylanicum]|uniref:G-protein coupled receptors family 1 profile domain-containing protein n=1 Tax=Ancylostoma ceylanicum TaxID=53326 RepID=A0A0D6M3Y2_9BILA|nr:hypothetical protein ANCCEY_03787 [Ancylostoma ceylanicum]